MTKSLLYWLLATFLLISAQSAGAQQAKKIPRIGFLAASPPSALSDRVQAFRQGLLERGYVEGKDIVVEYRYGGGELDRVAGPASELVRLKVDVIVTHGAQATLPAKRATSTIPIVMAQDNDLLGAGFVVSLARPGGNVTGLSNLTAELAGKQLELLKEIMPKLSRLAVLRDLTEPGTPRAVKETDHAALGFGVQLHYTEIQGPGDIESAFHAAGSSRVDALLVLTSAIFNSNRQQLLDLATKNRLPAMYSRAEFVQEEVL
jgi:putative ABC transport system substrate-binding protein